MKNLIVIIITLAFYSNIFAQTDTIPAIDTIPTPKNDTTYYEHDGRTRTISIEIGDGDHSRKVKTRWLMLDVGISTYLHEGSLNMPTELKAMDQKLLGSTNWNLHIVQQRIALTKKNRVNLTYGVSLDFSKYKFNNDFTLQPELDEVTFIDNPNIDFKKNQLNTTYLTAPLMLGFRIKPKKSRRAFNIKAGVYGGILLASKTKQKIKGESNVKVRDDFNLNKARYGATIRAGYGIFNVYMNYSATSLFKESEQGDYDLYPISFGVAIIPF